MQNSLIDPGMAQEENGPNNPVAKVRWVCWQPREEGGQVMATVQGWACVDCLFYLANGELPENRPDYLADVGRVTCGTEVMLGGQHEEDCPNVGARGQWLGESDCDCERMEFSWSRCDVCGSGLGGSRDAVTFCWDDDGKVGK